jgi:hypothetical protein
MTLIAFAAPVVKKTTDEDWSCISGMQDQTRQGASLLIAVEDKWQELWTVYFHQIWLLLTFIYSENARKS